MLFTRCVCLPGEHNVIFLFGDRYLLSSRFERNQFPLFANWWGKKNQQPFVVTCTKPTEALLSVCADTGKAALVHALHRLQPHEGVLPGPPGHRWD